MKRDMELVRKIVFAIENYPSGYAPKSLIIDDYTDEQISYHVYIMSKAGLVEGLDVTNSNSTSPQAIARNLTWQGHEFAEAARDDTRWNEAMKIVKEKGGTVTIGVLTQLLSALMKNSFGLS